jgi:phytoene dehydrogenase-like protein
VKAVVIGSGADALVAAKLLSSSHEVTALADGEPGERGWVPPPVRDVLGPHIVREELPDPWAVAPLPQGGRLELWRDMRRTVDSIRRVSERDALRWPEFCSRMARLSGFLGKLYLEAPPDPLGLRFALRTRMLGRQGLIDLMRLLPMSVAELLDDWFENEILKGILGAAGVMGLRQGPRSGGTAFVFLHHHVGSPPGVFRPPRTTVVSETDVQKKKVQRILVNEGRARGVVRADGTEIAADLVVSALHPQRTLLELVDPAWLDPELVRAVRHIRSRAAAAHVVLELDRAPEFTTLVHAPSLDYLERAYDDSKYGCASANPWVEICHDEVDVQYVPEGTSPDLQKIASCLGGARILSSKVLFPQPVAELTLDQALWMRPLPELAHYRTPIDGLWLCGPSMHPGPGILGASGYNCARAVLGS